jgi:hypothetical protein
MRRRTIWNGRWIPVTVILAGAGLAGHAFAQRYVPYLPEKVEQQERHIDSDDKHIQSNTEDIQRLLVRIEGDEDFLKGALGVIGFMQSLGLIKSFQGKRA